MQTVTRQIVRSTDKKRRKFKHCIMAAQHVALFTLCYTTLLKTILWFQRNTPPSFLTFEPMATKIIIFNCRKGPFKLTICLSHFKGSISWLYLHYQTGGWYHMDPDLGWDISWQVDCNTSKGLLYKDTKWLPGTFWLLYFLP